ncbi:hypothetical protein FKG94_27390 [Exilibacterium tricleocarpae]|uniref:Uncharacterized protein n=1 Tax=Exilibacterium tricleocarpae TaxID=2591008 RepID=A0A545SMX3_9GAMM|nr:MGMT family protein [Exilibacterium tricleocarpae]TQV66319.1 hypothetical protein FKG94_27390 [Exilibacterium tricleocarpae]
MSDEILKIPKTMEKFFGGSGKMVKPSVKTVVRYVNKIPRGKLASIEALRDKLARVNKVDVACPAGTMKSIKMAIKDEEKLCYWRLIKKDGSLISQFPGGVKEQQRSLLEEGIEVEENKGKPRVTNFDKKLFSFG